jgi:K+ transport systems, NAD-binding component
MSASYLLENRDTMSMKQQVEVIRTTAPALAGQTVAEANIREQTGCTVLAIGRDEATVTEIGPDTTVQTEDELVVVGTDDDIRAFEEQFT